MAVSLVHWISAAEMAFARTTVRQIVAGLYSRFDCIGKHDW